MDIGNLSILPEMVIILCLSFCDPKSVERFRTTCKKANIIGNDRYIWNLFAKTICDYDLDCFTKIYIKDNEDSKTAIRNIPPNLSSSSKNHYLVNNGWISSEEIIQNLPPDFDYFVKVWKSIEDGKARFVTSNEIIQKIPSDIGQMCYQKELENGDQTICDLMCSSPVGLYRVIYKAKNWNGVCQYKFKRGISKYQIHGRRTAPFSKFCSSCRKRLHT
ncbi:Hypothetical protein HVR_LOCUS378 [uncultured virus]|nr:Hypothetical protein HVR_LOCUS378 [uncultured virus]